MQLYSALKVSKCENERHHYAQQERLFRGRTGGIVYQRAVGNGYRRVAL
jgi:hypothetical protein